MNLRSCLSALAASVAFLITSMAAVYGAFLLASTFLASAEALSKDVVAAIVAAVGTVIASVATVVYNQRESKAREIAEAQRPQKIEVYNQFMRFIVEQMINVKKEETSLGDDGLDPELFEHFMGIKRDLILWASPQVIHSYRKFEQLGVEESDPDPEEVLFAVDEVLQAIRKDLDNSNWALTEGELIQLFLSDRISDI